MGKDLVLGLCEGRHEIPEVSEYIFPKGFFSGSDMFDFDRMHARVHEVLEDCTSVKVYVTGYTPALVEVINYCVADLIPLKLMHFNRETNSYVEQHVLSNYWVGELMDGGFVS